MEKRGKSKKKNSGTNAKTQLNGLPTIGTEGKGQKRPNNAHAEEIEAKTNGINVNSDNGAEAVISTNGDIINLSADSIKASLNVGKCDVNVDHVADQLGRIELTNGEGTHCGDLTTNSAIESVVRTDTVKSVEIAKSFTSDSKEVVTHATLEKCNKEFSSSSAVEKASPENEQVEQHLELKSHDTVVTNVLEDQTEENQDENQLNRDVESDCKSKDPGSSNSNCTAEDDSIRYISYESELQMGSIMKLIQKDLSEPYSVYTYRYFIHNWPKLCFLAMDGDNMVGVIVCKLDVHKINKRGYIAMLAVDEKYRRRKIGSNLVLKSIRAMVQEDADEIVLETEITNKSALRLYENLGFVRDKRLFRYYLNGVDALRLKLWLK